MIMKNRTNKLVKIFLIISLIGLNLEPCLAWSGSFGIPSSGGSGGGGGGGGGGVGALPFGSWKNYDAGSKRYQYRSQQVVTPNKTISVNAYNLDGESVIPNDIYIDRDDYTFKAGTWVGINVTEVHTATWAVYGVEFQEVRKKYTCHYTKPGGTKYKVVTSSIKRDVCSKKIDPSVVSVIMEPIVLCKYKVPDGNYPDKTMDYEVTKDYNEEYTCPSKHPDDRSFSYDSVTPEDVYESGGGAYEEAMKQQAYNNARSTAASNVGNPQGMVKYTISNNDYPDIDDGEVFEYEYITANATVTEGNVCTGVAPSGGCIQTYEFLQKKVCINARGSKVTYGRDCTSSELKVNNGRIYDSYLGETVTYWHYFIPLNTKSNDSFSFEVIKNGSSHISYEACKHYMEETLNRNPSEYEKYLVPYGDYQFVGNHRENMNILEDADGCQIAVKVNLPISQEFYNETSNEGELNFKGYNFYYKPITIPTQKNNMQKVVFPNGLSDSSNWKEWYDAARNATPIKPDLTDSFKNLSYVATITSPNDIRNYTNEEGNKPLYTSWESIGLDGKSSLIGDGLNSIGIDRLNTNLYKVYKLGCGPANADWGDCRT